MKVAVLISQCTQIKSPCWTPQTCTVMGVNSVSKTEKSEAICVFPAGLHFLGPAVPEVATLLPLAFCHFNAFSFAVN